MMTFELSTPVVFIVFNRINETKQVFSSIAQARPKQLYVISDGPRESRLGEDKRVEEIRNYIIKNVDWPCEVKINFAEKNLGCRDRIVSGLNWVFDQVESAIILEDDCVPDLTFFRFCQEMLDKFQSDKSISHISGTNLLGETVRFDSSYWFSSYTQIWGWATWSRVWKDYDELALDWPDFKRSRAFKARTLSPAARRYWANAFRSVYKQQIDTWDYQFSLLAWRQNLKTVVPMTNLISNIGFGENATHTLNRGSSFSRFPTSPLEFPLIHPEKNEVDRLRDLKISQNQFEMNWATYLMFSLYAVLPKSTQNLVSRGFGILRNIFRSDGL